MGMLAVAGQRMSWRASGAEAAGFFNFIVECPNTPSIRLAGSDVGGIWRSVDSGETWTRAADDGDTGALWKIASIIWWPVFTSSATDAGRVIALAGTSLGTGIGNSVVYESVDFGATFHTAWDNPSTGGASAGQTFGFSGDTNGTYGSPVGSGKGSNGSQNNVAIALPPGDGPPGDTNSGGFEHPRSTGYLGVVDTASHLVYLASFNDGVWRVPYTAGKPWIAPSSPTSPTSPGTGINAPGGSSPAAKQIIDGIGQGIGFNSPNAGTASDHSDLYGRGLTADPSDPTTLYLATFGNGVWRISNANGSATAAPLYTPGWTLNSIDFFDAGSGSGWPTGTSPISGTAGPCRVEQMGWYGSTLIMACNNDGIWAIKTPSATPTLTNLSAAGAGPDLPVASAGGAGICHWQGLGLCHSSGDGLQHLPQDSFGNALIFASATKPKTYSSSKIVNSSFGGGTNYTTASTTISVSSSSGWNVTACTSLKLFGNRQLPPIPISGISSGTITLGGTLTSAQVTALNASGAQVYMPCWTVAFASFNASLTAQSVSNGQTTTPGWVDPWGGSYDAIEWGTTRTWWLLPLIGFLPDGNNAGYPAIRVPQGASHIITEVQLAGRSGIWLTQDGFDTSHPSVAGLLTTYSKGGVSGVTNKDVYICFSDFSGGYTPDDGFTVTAENFSGLGLTGTPYGYDAAVDTVGMNAYYAIAQRNLTSGNENGQAGYVFSRPAGPPAADFSDEILFPASGGSSINVTDTLHRATTSNWGTSSDGSVWTVPSGIAPATDFSTQTSLVFGGNTITAGSAPNGSGAALGASDGLGLIKSLTTDGTTGHAINDATTQNLCSGSILLGFDSLSSAVAANLFAGVRILAMVGTSAAGTASANTFYEARFITGSGNTQIQLRKMVAGTVDTTDFFNVANAGVGIVVPTWGAPPVNTLWTLNWQLVGDGSGGVNLTAWIIDHNGNDSRSIAKTMSLTINSTAVTGTGFITSMDQLPVSGTNIPAGTIFNYVSSTTGTLSKQASATASVTATLTFAITANDNASQAIPGPGNFVVFAGTSALPSSTVNAIVSRINSVGAGSGATSSKPGFAPLRLLAVPTGGGTTQLVAFCNQTGVLTKLLGTDTQFNQSATSGLNNPMGSVQPSQQTMWVVSNNLTGSGATLPAIYALHPNYGAFRSNDYGATWLRIWGPGSANSGFNTFNQGFIGGLAIDPAHPDDLIIITPNGGTASGASTGQIQILVNARTCSGTFSATTGLLGTGSPSLTTVSLTGGPAQPGVCMWIPAMGLIVTNRILNSGDVSTLWNCPSPSAGTPIWNRIDDPPYTNVTRQMFALNCTADFNHLLAHCSGNGVMVRALT